MLLKTKVVSTLYVGKGPPQLSTVNRFAILGAAEVVRLFQSESFGASRKRD